jgi:hypothetical protein
MMFACYGELPVRDMRASPRWLIDPRLPCHRKARLDLLLCRHRAWPGEPAALRLQRSRTAVPDGLWVQPVSPGQHGWRRFPLIVTWPLRRPLAGSSRSKARRISRPSFYAIEWRSAWEIRTARGNTLSRALRILPRTIAHERLRNRSSRCVNASRVESA